MKTVVITGGTRGLGLELAKCFKKRNYNVVICGKNPERLVSAVETVRKIKGKGRCVGTVCDVSDSCDVRVLAEFALKHFKRIDIWINNAGVNQSYQYAWELSEEEIDFLLDIDLKGTINGTTVAIRIMKSQGFGAIYNMEGMGSNDSFQSCFAIYGTAKRAVTYYTDAVAKEIKQAGLNIVIGKLAPGIMLTDFLTSSNGKNRTTVLPEKVKNVYRILGDHPDVIAEYLVKKMVRNKKNGVRITWLTKKKAMLKFAKAKRK